jgi:hypothetical protein
MKRMAKRTFLIIVVIGAVASSALGLSFKQVAYIPNGIVWSIGYMKGIDANHDGYQDLIFTNARPFVVYYGYRPYNRYIPEDSCSQRLIFWDVGDLDGDSLLDVLTQRDDVSPSGIRILEPSNYWSFPKFTAWSWRFEVFGYGLQPMYVTDLDQDGLKEIVCADAEVVYVFENRGDNQYQKVFCDTVLTGDPTGSFAFGDFDGDGQMEFAVPTYGSSDTTVFVYKCTGNDQYQRVWGEHLETVNMYDCISLPNIKGDGKTDFMIGSLKTGIGQWYGQMFIYEATSINQYQVIFADSIPVTNRGGYSVHSACGDVDRDGKPELVWAIDRSWMVYKYDSLGHQFQRVYSLGDNGHNSTNIHIHDMNGNGYPEIIESGGNETHIWEVEAAQVVYPNGGETLYWDSSCVVRWRNVTPFVADSFSLFFSTDSSRSYSLIAHGIPGSDSTYAWTVPDTLSDTCFIMVWAYQNAVGWDFSDQAFRIRRPDGVEVKEVFSSPISRLPYHVTPNPFVSFAMTPGHERERFSLYDVSGRKVGIYKGDRIGSGLSAGIYFLKPEREGANPLRVVKLR